MSKHTKKHVLFQLGALAPALAFALLISCSGSSTAKVRPHYSFKEGQGPAGVVASVDGKHITEDELIGDERLEFAEVFKKLYDLRMDRLGRVLLDKVYGDKAKQAKQSLEEYLDKNVFKGEEKISDKEYNKFVEEKQIPKDQLNPQLKERIMGYMKMQKRQESLKGLVAKVTKEHKVDVYFPRAAVKVNIEAGNAASFGDKNAKVKIVEFSDFQCPYCSRAGKTVAELKKAYGKKVHFAFRQFPLPNHPQARPASEASLCVNEQGEDKFWKYHDKLFANQEKLDDESLKKHAKEVGVNVEKFNQCFDSHKYANAVSADVDYANKMGIRSTPTFFVNGRLLSGAQPLEAFEDIIEEEMSAN